MALTVMVGGVIMGMGMMRVLVRRQAGLCCGYNVVVVDFLFFFNLGFYLLLLLVHESRLRDKYWFREK